MDNVVLKSTFEFTNYGKAVNVPKRIKLSNTSNGNVRAKVRSLSDSEKSSNDRIISFPRAYLEQSKNSESKESSTNRVISFPRVYLDQSENSESKQTSTSKVISFPRVYLEQSKDPESKEISTNKVISFPRVYLDQANQKNEHHTDDKETVDNHAIASVLENINLESSNYYTSQPINSLSSRLIRLTDVMYNRVIKHTATTQKNDAVAFEEISHSSSMASQDEKDTSISIDNVNDKNLDSEKMKSTVDVAFDSAPSEISEKQENSVVKKASYTKAKVKKYQIDSKLPTNMISGNGLFQSDTTVSNSESRDDDVVINREVPIVVPERKDKFLFNDLNLTSEVSEQANDAKVDDTSISELKKIQISSEDDTDFEELLAKVEKRLQDQEASHSKKVDAEKEFQSSVEVLKTAAQRYDVSSEALEEVKEKAYAYLNEIEADIENNMKKEQELRVMTEQQIQEARKIEAAADRNEAHIEQFNSVLAVVPNSQVSDNAKTYSRAA